jgi:hypothetical protein
MNQKNDYIERWLKKSKRPLTPANHPWHERSQLNTEADQKKLKVKDTSSQNKGKK